MTPRAEAIIARQSRELGVFMQVRPWQLIFCGLLLLVSRGVVADAPVSREGLFARSDPGIRIHVREVRAGTQTGCKPVLLVHGARVPGVASFDLPVPGGSLAADLAQHGFCAYVMEVRGYGQSTRPPEMEERPQNHPPLVRSVEAVRDIDAAVELIRKRTGARRVALFGWATGGQWAGHYATLHSEKLSHLILLNALYGADAPHPLMGHGSDMEDPAHPGMLNPAVGAYRCNDAASLLGAWNRSIPIEDKSAWRDSAVADAYVQAALASDPETGKRQPPCFRSPNGALEDSFYLATGRQLWDASFIEVPTLVLASERDFWSRPADREKLAHDLAHAPAVRVVVIPGATHFVHLDRPQRGRDLLLREVLRFLGNDLNPSKATANQSVPAGDQLIGSARQ
jgi:pimeloyl-ACP methyl ester carboxylesterase